MLLKTSALGVDFDADRRALQASGALARMVQPVLNTMNQRLAEEKPALIRLKDMVLSTWLPPIPSGPFKRLLANEARAAIGRPVPSTVSIEVTRSCGARCDHCLIREGEGELSRQEITSVIDQVLEMGSCIITFTEGDPLLREDIFDLVRGVAGAHAMALKAIRIALDAGLMVTMSCHIKAGQVDRILDLYNLATELGVQELSVWEGMPRSPEEKLTLIEKEKIIDIYRKINSTAGGPRIFANTYFEGQMLGCMAGRRWMHVAVDGSIRGCPYLKESYANIREVSLKDAWKALRGSGQFEGSVCHCPAQEIFG
ncbi:MAG: radical SAM protein [Methanothrix sp.]|nr:radical SAM protein [Methanothrix sp.]